MQKTTGLVGRTLLLSFALALFLPVLSASSAWAQEEAQASKEASSEGNKDDSWGDEKAPEGFVRSKEPAKGDSPYNWKQMAYASVVILASAGGLYLLIKKNTRNED